MFQQTLLPKRKLKVIAIFAACFTFIAVSVLGFGHTVGMGMNENGEMSGCIFTGKVMLCKMTIVEHISFWQSILTAVPQKVFNSLLLILLLAFASLIHWNNLVRSRAPDIARRIRAKSYETISIIDPIRRALSRGIIQPQIYNPIIG